MSVIQQIQEKYAKLMAVIIAIALIIFVVMLAFENGGTLFNSGNTNTVGKVNGREIGYDAFQAKVEQTENYMKTQGYGGGAAATRQAIDNTWTQEVNRLLVASEVEKLGLKIGKKELGDILYGPNAPDDLKQQFTDPQTGIYNGAMAKQQIDNLLKKGKPEERARVNEYINQLEFMRLSEKYNSLLGNSINIPKWIVEKEKADNSQLAKVSFVREVYSSIPDSTIKISDKEIEVYVSKHKDDFKQEESRSVYYVAFSALPTATDSAAAREQIMNLKPELDSAKDVRLFLETQGIQNFYDSYIGGSRIQVPSKDSILKLAPGTIYGPYIDAGNYALAKLIGTRVQPDTVNFRHILISTQQRDSTSARKLIDSLRTAIQAGSNFDSLAAKFSEDQGSKDKGGLYEKVEAGSMVPAFNDFIFGHPAGSKDIVTTDYGYHYIEILSQKGSSMAYKIAYLTVPIQASEATDANASNEATLFAGDSRNLKSFDANAEKLKAKGINKLYEPNIPPNGYQLQMGVSREFVRSVYEADLGDVLQPIRVGDHYLVAVVSEVNKKGTQSAAKARPMVEGLLRNHKKAEQLIKKLDNASTLEAAASAWGGKTIEIVDSVRFSGAQSSVLAGESKVIGAAFNPANKGKVTPPIEGVSGVYVARVDNVTATPVMGASVAEERKTRYEQAKMRGVYPQQALMEAATIKDNRSKVY